jgi:hypothetical protein
MSKKIQKNALNYFIVSIIIIIIMTLGARLEILFNKIPEGLFLTIYYISILFSVFSGGILLFGLKPKLKYLLFSMVMFLVSFPALILMFVKDFFDFEGFFTLTTMFIISIVIFKVYISTLKKEKKCTQETTAQIIEVLSNSKSTILPQGNSFSHVDYSSVDYNIVYLGNINNILYEQQISGYPVFKEGDIINIKYNL